MFSKYYRPKIKRSLQDARCEEIGLSNQLNVFIEPYFSVAFTLCIIFTFFFSPHALDQFSSVFAYVKMQYFIDFYPNVIFILVCLSWLTLFSLFKFRDSVQIGTKFGNLASMWKWMWTVKHIENNYGNKVGLFTELHYTREFNNLIIIITSVVVNH